MSNNTDDEEKPKVRTPNAVPLEQATKPPMTDQDALGFVQTRLVELAEHARTAMDLTRASSVTAYVGIMAEMRQLAQQNIKNNIEERSGVAGARELVSDIFKALGSPSNNVFMHQQEDGAPARTPPKLSDNVPAAIMVPGETGVGVENLAVEDFVGKNAGRTSTDDSSSDELPPA